MKKKLTALGAIVLLLFMLTVPVFAAKVPPVSGEPAKERVYPLFVDDAQLLEETDAAELLTKLEEISARQKMDVAVITAAKMDGRSVESYTDDFYDYFGYGQGDSKDGVMFLITMEEREVYITASGSGIFAFTDAGREYILDNCVMPLISDGKYSDAFNEFADQCDIFINQAKTGTPYDGNHMPKGQLEPLDTTWFFVAFIAGIFITTGVSIHLKKQMETVEFQREANNYAVDGSLVITGKFEKYITTNITRKEREHSSDRSGDSKGSGSTTRKSSSDATHSGTGRKF